MPHPVMIGLKLAGFAVAATFLTTQALAQARPDVLASASDAAEICQRHLGSLSDVMQDIKGAGFTYKGAWGRSRVNPYVADGWGVFIGSTLPSDSRQACLIFVPRMTVEQANELIAP